VQGDGSELERAGAVLLGLPDFAVLAAAEVGGEIELVVQTVAGPVGCPRCGVVAAGKGRRPALLRDLPARGRPVVLIWHKRLWACPDSVCPQGSWTETHPQVRARAVLTERARRWAFEQVGRCKRTVAAVAAELGVGWWTVMRAVREFGEPLVDDPVRVDGVSAVGVDEHAFLAATPIKPTTYVTGVVDITPGRPPRLLDVLPGRSGKIYAEWLAEQEQAWRDQVRVAALDPFRGYATALRTELPAAQRVLDAFHVTRLGFAALDEVRRRVQHDTTGHRGRRGDPLYGIRRVLRRGRDKLTDRARARMLTGLDAGDPHGEVAAAWTVAHQLREVYQARTPEDGRRRAAAAEAAALTCPVPEVRRLGRTLRSWRAEWLAYFHTGGASNGPVEAMNLNIETSRRIAYGFRNFRNYRLRLLLAYGHTWQTSLTPRIRGPHPLIVA
jgi:transposase